MEGATSLRITTLLKSDRCIGCVSERSLLFAALIQRHRRRANCLQQIAEHSTDNRRVGLLGWPNILWFYLVIKEAGLIWQRRRRNRLNNLRDQKRGIDAQV